MVDEPTGMFVDLMWYAARSIEALGVIVICVGVITTTGLFLYRSWMHRNADRFYRIYRRGMGKAILLGLELLVAGDIILTATHNFNLQHIALLGLLILIRTFLSFSMEIELNGYLPWKRPLDRDDDV
ncbi:Uncharacterized membrane protein [Desulfonatronum thiosulfatophilum]|uniref:Uncharacterized membrane protein n=1 Tax=Desulfonatronum thiosulfatophilum TaxID=617002 RepID=A0A1G6D2E1_9BACT|nr:DUF1622 domain-containing protein [Desulfonatronum thiosulfatophilum]SDB39314.1 Uncharacterized membrane protein [Desulfonatronum thiosulfatophilum]